MCDCLWCCCSPLLTVDNVPRTLFTPEWAALIYIYICSRRVDVLVNLLLLVWLLDGTRFVQTMLLLVSSSRVAVVIVLHACLTRDQTQQQHKLQMSCVSRQYKTHKTLMGLYYRVLRSFGMNGRVYRLFRSRGSATSTFRESPGKIEWGRKGSGKLLYLLNGDDDVPIGHSYAKSWAIGEAYQLPQEQNQLYFNRIY